MFYYENKLKSEGFDFIVGIDEAGRGPLAGPVVASAVVILENNFENRIDDSKKLSSLQRDKAYLEIVSKTVFGLGIVDEKIIDRINILQATRLAMKDAVTALLNKTKSSLNKKIHLLIDGDIALDFDFPYTSIIKGDSKSKSIASASILAKVTRDKLMDEYDKIYPQYGFIQHKGYPTKRHKLAIKKFGFCNIHRTTFNSV